MDSLRESAATHRGTVEGMLLSIVVSNDKGIPYPLSERVAHHYKDNQLNLPLKALPNFEQSDGLFVKFQNYQFSTANDDEARDLYTSWAKCKIKEYGIALVLDTKEHE